MEAKNTQLQEETIVRIQKKMQEEKGKSHGANTLGESISKVSKLENGKDNSVSQNGQEIQAEESTESKTGARPYKKGPSEKLTAQSEEKPKNKSINNGRLSKRPESPKKRRPDGKEKQAEESTENEKREKLGNISNIIEIGDVVLPRGESDGVFEKGKFWFLKEVIEEEDGVENLHLVLRTEDGYEAGSLGISWEQITPQYETPEQYLNKLKTIHGALERARDKGDEYRADKLADLLKQVRHFALIFSNKTNS
jgi:hypothetical protein